jgi:hypothetical protein
VRRPFREAEAGPTEPAGRLTNVTSEDPRRDEAAGAPPPEPGLESAVAPDLVRPAAGTTSFPVDSASGSSVWPTNDDLRSDEVPEPVKTPRRRTAVLGIISFTLAAILVVANIVGIVLANSGTAREVALGIAFATIFGTILTFVGGLIAAIANLGRTWGVGAIVLSVLGNPFVLVVLFGLFTGALRP